MFFFPLPGWIFPFQPALSGLGLKTVRSLLKWPQSEMNNLFTPCCDPKNTHNVGFSGVLCLEGVNRGRMPLSLRCLGGNARDCSITSCVLKYHPASLLFPNYAGDPAGHSEPSRALGMLLVGLLELNCPSGRIHSRVCLFQF